MKSNYNFGRASLSNVESGAAAMGGREGIKKCEKREKKAPFIGEEVAAPRIKSSSSSWW
jgi:hypothetical protein